MAQRANLFTLPDQPTENSMLSAPTRSRMMIMGPDKQQLWDHFIAASPTGHLLQCWAWGEVKRAFGWEPLRIAFWDASFQHLVAGAQVLLRPIPLTGYSVAYLPKGPVLDWSDTELSQSFFTALHALLKTRRVAFLQMEPDLPEKVQILSPERSEEGFDASGTIPDPETFFGGRYSVAQGQMVARHLKALGFLPNQDHIQPIRTIVVDLTPDEATIALRQTRSRRYNANLAARRGVTIRPARGLDDLRRWYSLLEITRERNRFAGHPFAYYQRAWEELRASDQVQLFLAEHGGKLLAGAFVTLVGKQSVYLYGASSNDERHLKPNDLLQREAIRQAKAQGAAFYDMWGIAATDDPADPQAGYTAFKQGWGGQVIQFIGTFDYIYVPTAHSAFVVGKKLLKSLVAARAALRQRRGPSRGINRASQK
jgi:peptidoglycan pentaglycine glycine transferase (the first glycine)